MYIYFIYKILAHGLILRGLIIGRFFRLRLGGRGELIGTLRYLDLFKNVFILNS